MPQRVDVKRLVVGPKKDLQAGHSVHFHFCKAILLLWPVHAAEGVIRVTWASCTILSIFGRVSLGSVHDHDHLALFGGIAFVFCLPALIIVDLQNDRLRLVDCLRLAHSYLEDLFCEFGAHKDKFVELEEKDDGVTVGKAYFLVANGDVHHELQGSYHGGQEYDGTGRSVCQLDVAHQKKEEVFYLRECVLCFLFNWRLNLLKWSSCCWKTTLSIVDVGYAIQTCLREIVVLLYALLVIVFHFLGFVNHPANGLDGFLKHLRGEDFIFTETDVGDESDKYLLAGKIITVWLVHKRSKQLSHELVAVCWPLHVAEGISDGWLL